MPPVVYLLCGLTGSGKTTYAKRLEAAGAVRLTVDEVDREVLLQRLADRNRRGDANAMPLLPADLEDFIARFDEPEGEGEELVRQGAPDVRQGGR